MLKRGNQKHLSENDNLTDLGYLYSFPQRGRIFQKRGNSLNKYWEANIFMLDFEQ